MLLSSVYCYKYDFFLIVMLTETHFSNRINSRMHFNEKVMLKNMKCNLLFLRFFRYPQKINEKQVVT